MRSAALPLIIAAVLLSACGVKGGLEQPPPLFGDAKRDFEAEQKRKAEAEAAAKPAADRQRVEIPVGAKPAEPETPEGVKPFVPPPGREAPLPKELTNPPLEAPAAPNAPPSPFQTGPNPR